MNANAGFQSRNEIFWGEIAPCEHIAQFYEHDGVLLDTLTGARRGTLVGASAAPIQSTTSSAVGCRRALRSSSVVGRQPARRHVDATEVATEGT